MLLNLYFLNVKFSKHNMHEMYMHSEQQIKKILKKKQEHIFQQK